MEVRHRAFRHEQDVVVLIRCSMGEVQGRYRGKDVVIPPGYGLLRGRGGLQVRRTIIFENKKKEGLQPCVMFVLVVHGCTELHRPVCAVAW